MVLLLPIAATAAATASASASTSRTLHCLAYDYNKIILHFTSHSDHSMLLPKCHQHTRFYHLLCVYFSGWHLSPRGCPPNLFPVNQTGRFLPGLGWIHPMDQGDQTFGAQDFDFGILIPFQFVSSPFFCDFSMRNQPGREYFGRSNEEVAYVTQFFLIQCKKDCTRENKI